MLFAITCLDRPGMLETRAANREAHLAHLRGAGDRLRVAGPFLNDREQPVGSLLLLEAADRTEAQAFADADPYARAGIFETVTIRPWRATVGQWAVA